MTAADLIAHLAGIECRCGAVKSSGESFCRKCGNRLPPPMKAALYRRAGNGYEQAYAAATEFLDALKRFRMPRAKSAAAGLAR